MEKVKRMRIIDERLHTITKSWILRIHHGALVRGFAAWLEVDRELRVEMAGDLVEQALMNMAEALRVQAMRTWIARTAEAKDRERRQLNIMALLCGQATRRLKSSGWRTWTARTSEERERKRLIMLRFLTLADSQYRHDTATRCLGMQRWLDIDRVMRKAACAAIVTRALVNMADALCSQAMRTWASRTSEAREHERRQQNTIALLVQGRSRRLLSCGWRTWMDKVERLRTIEATCRRVAESWNRRIHHGALVSGLATWLEFDSTKLQWERKQAQAQSVVQILQRLQNALQATAFHTWRESARHSGMWEKAAGYLVKNHVRAMGVALATWVHVLEAEKERCNLFVRLTEDSAKKRRSTLSRTLIGVTVVEGRDLTKMDWGGLSDPYVTVKFGKKETYKSAIIKKTLNARWDFKCVVGSVEHIGAGGQMEFDVWDWDMIGRDEKIGSVAVNVTSIVTTPEDGDAVQLLLEGKHAKNSKIYVRFVVIKDPAAEDDDALPPMPPRPRGRLSTPRRLQMATRSSSSPYVAPDDYDPEVLAALPSFPMGRGDVRDTRR